MSEYFKKEKHGRDKELFVNFMLYLFVVTALMFLVLGVLGVAKSSISKAVDSCVGNGYSLNYCKFIAK